MKWIFQRFFFPNLLCDFLRIQCAACSGFAVRHAPDSVCDMLRIMHKADRRVRSATEDSEVVSAEIKNEHLQVFIFYFLI